MKGRCSLLCIFLDSLVLARELQLVDQLEAFALSLVFKLSSVVCVEGIVCWVVNGTLKEVRLVQSVVDLWLVLVSLDLSEIHRCMSRVGFGPTGG